MVSVFRGILANYETAVSFQRDNIILIVHIYASLKNATTLDLMLF